MVRVEDCKEGMDLKEKLYLRDERGKSGVVLGGYWGQEVRSSEGGGGLVPEE